MIQTTLYKSLLECKDSSIILDICLELLQSNYDKEYILCIIDEYIDNNIINDMYDETVYDIINWLIYYTEIKLPIE